MGGYTVPIAIHAVRDFICLEEAFVELVPFLALPVQMFILATLASLVISSSIPYVLLLVHTLASRAGFIQLYAHHV